MSSLTISTTTQRHGGGSAEGKGMARLSCCSATLATASTTSSTFGQGECNGCNVLAPTLPLPPILDDNHVVESFPLPLPPQPNLATQQAEVGIILVGDRVKEDPPTPKRRATSHLGSRRWASKFQKIFPPPVPPEIRIGQS